jgi:hypothetical protein
MLDDLNDFIGACAQHASALTQPHTAFAANDIYCPGCGAPRRVSIIARVTGIPRGAGLNLAEATITSIGEQLVPALFEMVCMQACGTSFTVLLFRGPEGFELAVFPSVRGGLALPHTPPGVAYYLDQAQRAESVDANSAAVAMYRAALEHILYEQGYTTRMLGPKLQELDAAIKNGTAPKWATELDPTYLKVLKQLGDASIHPGDGDVSRQSALNEKLLRNVKITFVELLRLAYEQPHEREERLKVLQASLAELEGS